MIHDTSQWRFLFCQWLANLILQFAAFKQAVIPTIKNNLPANSQEVALSYYVAGIFGVYKDWLAGDIIATPEELVTMLGQLANQE